MSTWREKIADWYFANHKIEDKLGHDPHLEESMLGKLKNTAMNSRAKTCVTGFALALAFNAMAFGETYTLIEVCGFSASLAALFEATERLSNKRSDSPACYFDTAPQCPVTLPNDEDLNAFMLKRYEEFNPQKGAVAALFWGTATSAAVCGVMGSLHLIPFVAAGVSIGYVERSRKYWQARQVLHENWQVYTTKPEKQTERERPPKTAPSPNV